ncbi:MAG TPA: acyl-ACP--UDP-N-acetylglucosamine O-acyltransferase, partial [candidate division Zixibacteria bacterium]|nr:acyl-ACP--UDP-N-acetylglucosamine O-acyltransferase [candidate division Zixibacteria bacterium]
MCTIGDHCQIGSSVAIHRWTELGPGVRVWHGASLGGDPQDLKYRGAKTGVSIGENTVVREFATVNLSTEEGHVTRVGRNCFLMAYSHVAHECSVGENVIMANSANLAGHVTVEDFAIIGGLTPIHQFVRVGCHCMIGGSSAVQKDVVPYTKAFGIPLKMYGLN